MARTAYNPRDIEKAEEFEFSPMYGFTEKEGEEADMFGEEIVYLRNYGDSLAKNIYTAYKLGYMVAKGIL